MTALAAAATGLLTRARARIRPPFLSVIDDWRYSDCTVPDRYPPDTLAPHWEGPLSGLCGSCSACRPEQRTPDGDWDDWLYLGGRGTGKTRAAAEDMARHAALYQGWRIALVAPTFSDCRDTCVEGESGLQAVFTRWGWEDGREYQWNRSIGEIKLRDSKSRFKLFSAEKPARLRGPQHHRAWVDELAQVVRDAPDAYDMLKFGLRLGRHPQAVLTTTPLPVALIVDMLTDDRVVTTKSTTDDNAANLPAVTLRSYHRRFDGTRLGRQELGAELLTDIPGALWRRTQIDDDRVDEIPDGVTLTRIVVSLDPAVTSGEDADESGLVVVGLGDDRELYVLEDATLREAPAVVMDAVLDAYDRWDANSVVVEINNGGDYIPAMLESALRAHDRDPAMIAVDTIHAKKGKRVRAEPVSALYAQHRVHHVGTHQHLEDSMCVWLPTSHDSPDRMDALVYAVLLLDDPISGSGVLREMATLQRHDQRRTIMSTTSVRSRR